MKPIRYHITQAAIYLSFLMVLVITAVIILFHLNIGGGNQLNNFHYLTEGNSPVEILYLILGKALFALIAGLTLRSLFKKTVSPEIFFFSLAIISLSFTSLRGLLLIERLLDYPASMSETITRIVYFGKIVTTLCLFTAGLFSTGISLQNQVPLLLLTMLISVILSSALPINVFETDSILLRGTASEYGMNSVFIILQLFAVLNFVIGALKNNEYDYLFLAVGVAMVAAGNELLFRLVPGWVSIGGFLLLLSGTLLFGYKTHKIYQWS